MQKHHSFRLVHNKTNNPMAIWPAIQIAQISVNQNNMIEERRTSPNETEKNYYLAVMCMF